MTRSTPPPPSKPTGRTFSTSGPAAASGRSADRFSNLPQPSERPSGPSDGLLGRSDVRELAQRLGLRPTKSRGQNFVTDANTIRRIVRLAALCPDDVVLEVGPGLGSLTLGLLAAAGSVIAVEIDSVLAAELPNTIRVRRPDLVERLQVVHADALRLPALAREPTTVVANLPYNVAVPVLLHLLEHVPSLRAGLVLVQAEVADRLAAAPGGRVYGGPSVKLAWFAEVARAGTVGRHVFWPEPRVESSLIAFTRRRPPSVAVTRAEVFAVVDAAFGQRRKTLRAALADWAGSAAAAEAVLLAAGIAPSARGEQLDVAAFARIAAAGKASTSPARVGS